MALGVRYQLNPINRGDTAEIFTALREREGVVPASEIAEVVFTVQQPNGIFAGNPTTLKTQPKGTIYQPEPNNKETKGFEVTGIPSTAGIIAGKTLIRGKHIKPGAVVTRVLSGTALLMDYESEAKNKEEVIEPLEFENIEWPGEVEEDGQGYLQWTKTQESGEYLVQSQFTLVNQAIKSVMANFAVMDPFNVPPPSEAQLVAEEVWLRFEDSFDSVEGGPILRDYTMAHFDVKKIERLIPEALITYNLQMPPSNYDISYFARPGAEGEINPHMPLLSKGVLCMTLLHMIRSYIEQPVPQGAQIAYEDRTRYAQAWQAQHKQEYEEWLMWIRLWKRQELLLGHSALLVGTKAGRLFYNGTWRTQNVGRGFF